MNICSTYNDIPSHIREAMSAANMFYEASYEANVKGRGQSLLYVWSENCILVVRIRKKLFFKVAILDTEPFIYNKVNVDEQKFIEDVMEKLKNNGVQWTFSTVTSRFQVYPKHSKVVLSGNHILDLTLSEEELWTGVHSKHRNSIRRGEKSNIEIVQGGMELLNDYCPISFETYERSNKSDGGEQYFKTVLSKLDNNEKIFIAKLNGEAQAGGMFYYNKAIAYYLHGASIRRPEPGATNFLLWKAITHFKSIGVKEFSFVGYHHDPEPGSKLEGIQRFKERFGGVLENSYYFRYIQQPFHYSLFCIYMQLTSGKPFSKYQDAIDKQIEKYPELNK